MVNLAARTGDFKFPKGSFASSISAWAAAHLKNDWRLRYRFAAAAAGWGGGGGGRERGGRGGGGGASRLMEP